MKRNNPPYARKDIGRVLNIAHRGARSLAPENTISAVKKALEEGADLWETDVILTSDNELMLFHDDTPIRTTNARDIFPDRCSFPVTSFSRSELESLDAGSWFLDTDPFDQIAGGKVSPEERQLFSMEKVPTLEKALEFTQKNDFFVNLEIKCPKNLKGNYPVIEKLFGLLDRMHFDTRSLVISSFHHEWLRTIRKLRPEMEIQALVGNENISDIDWNYPQFRTYNLNASLAEPDLVNTLNGKGISVNVYTVNDPDEMTRFASLGVSGIITDFPQILRELKGKGRNFL